MAGKIQEIHEGSESPAFGLSAINYEAYKSLSSYGFPAPAAGFRRFFLLRSTLISKPYCRLQPAWSANLPGLLLPHPDNRRARCSTTGRR